MIELYKKIKDLELTDVYKYIMKNNNSYNLPYHNNFHLEHVSLFVIKGCEYFNIEKSYQKLMIVASLFHDFNHTGSGKDDDVNILKAVEGFLEYNNEYEKFIEDEVKFITELIKSTRYPYLKVCEDLNIYQQIIRDSDILQGPFCQNYLNGVVFAIAKEANIDLEKMLSGQKEFLKNTTFCTDWANELYKNVLPEVIKKIDEII
jgi:hypothetical protein